MNNKEIFEKYKDKVVGRTNMDYPIYVNKLRDEEGLKEFLFNMYSSQDEILTKDGFNFLEEYYGFDKITEFILKEKSRGVDYNFTTEKEVEHWLKQIRNVDVE